MLAIEGSNSFPRKQLAVNNTVVSDRMPDAPKPKQHACLSAAADKDHMTADDPLGSDDEEEGSEDEDDSQGGMDSISEEEEEDKGSDEEEGGRLLKATLEARQAARAAGDHPLQQSFRAAAAQLLEKYATGADKRKRKRKRQESASAGNRNDSPGQEDEEGGGTEAEEEEKESKDESTAVSEEEEEQAQETATSAGSSDTSKVSDQQKQQPRSQPGEPHLSNAQRTERQQAHAEAQSSDQAHAAAVHAVPADPTQADEDDIPFTIAAPSSYAAFAQLAKGQGPSRLGLIIQRIRACNAIALATDNRRKLQASPAIAP